MKHIITSITALLALLTIPLAAAQNDWVIDVENSSGGFTETRINGSYLFPWAFTFNAGILSPIVVEGTDDAFEFTLTFADPTADRILTFADASGTVVLSTLSTNAPEAANSVWLESNAIAAEGSTANSGEMRIAFQFGADSADKQFNLNPYATATVAFLCSTLSTNNEDAINSIWGISNGFRGEGATADGNEGDLLWPNVTADTTWVLPNISGFIVATGNTTVNLTADDQAVTTTDYSLIILTSDDGTAANRTAVLSAGRNGQRLTLLWSGANAGEIADSGTANLSATWTPAAGDTLSLTCDGTTWFEVSRSDN